MKKVPVFVFLLFAAPSNPVGRGQDAAARARGATLLRPVPPEAETKQRPKNHSRQQRLLRLHSNKQMDGHAWIGRRKLMDEPQPFLRPYSVGQGCHDLARTFPTGTFYRLILCEGNMKS